MNIQSLGTNNDTNMSGNVSDTNINNTKISDISREFRE
jgi:hypothetical protein